ncbi:11555_t:CDS:10 [Diversispora eburnea]|uniref:11555_t:CDS:1 n=1 Tax=Diversispora eburnea TaxID=1213867 RepID=A0A9N9C249_9GLOM|nr:11555_t:CDS:10 [Diversispora eburnea]
MYFSLDSVDIIVWAFITIYVIYWIGSPRLSKNEPPMVPYKIPIIGHTLDYLFNAENFMEEFGNEITHEVFRTDAFSLIAATRELFPLYRVLKNHDDPKAMDRVVNTIRKGITPKLPLYNERLQKQLMISIDKEIGDCSKPKLIDTTDELTSLSARPVADILVGQEASKNEDLVKAFATFKRLKDKEILGEKYEPPLDLIEYLLNDPDFETKVVTDDYVDKLCDFLYVIVVASVHTTSRHLTCALYDYGGRPELWDDIYEEQVKIDKECNGVLTSQHINKLVKLDSFIRETLRTFGSAGRTIQASLGDVHYNTTTYGPEPKSFLPYHGLEKNLPASKTDKNYFIFGTGKYTCPGRFFAVNEIKVCFHKLILKYHIKTPSGKPEKKKVVGPAAHPPYAGLIFENRKN